MAKETRRVVQGGKLSGIGTMKTSDKIVMKFDNIKKMYVPSPFTPLRHATMLIS